MEKLSIPVLLGTCRESGQSPKVAQLVHEEAIKYGFDSQLLVACDYNINQTAFAEENNNAQPWQEVMTRADGLIVVSPEYNHGYPGELKMCLDALYSEYNNKPLGICGVSSNMMGGVRMVEQLKLIAIELQMHPIRESVYLSKVRDLFNEDGSLRDPAVYAERFKKFFDQLGWWARVLKSARDHNNG